MPAPRLTLALSAVGLAAVLALTGCTSAATGAAPSAESNSAAAGAQPATGAMVDAETFASALAAPGTVVLDVRTPEEFAQGHLPGAINIDVSSPDFAKQVAELDPAGSYAVYCRSGNRSATAVQIMEQQGFTGMYHLSGGIGAWSKAGGKIVTG